MDLCYLCKFQIFILYLNKNITKISDLFKGGAKILQVAAVFMADFVFCCFEHLFEFQDDFFGVFDI
jgi:hypothetical protein